MKKRREVRREKKHKSPTQKKKQHNEEGDAVSPHHGWSVHFIGNNNCNINVISSSDRIVLCVGFVLHI
jgi:hypothetical protein